MAPKYTNKLEGKSVLVVGGTSGMGFAVAEASVEFGASVVVASRSKAKVDDAVRRLATSYPDAKDRIRGHTVDLSGEDSETSITELFYFVTNGGKDKVDHVVETAGDAPSAGLALEEVTVQRIVEASSPRFSGIVMLAKVAAQHLKQAHTSSLTLTGGVASFKPFPGWSVMAAIGGAKEALARGLAVDMKPVRVNLVSPGAVQTELFDAVVEKSDPEAAKAVFRHDTLLGRIGDPEDLAEAYLSLMKNYFATGTTTHVEGGKLLR
ncbi:Tropinone reductase 2 [Colletotrichum chlorophyti]|uniref:Tropinone reductase 2 n=1 Tax=Colletotrichum chlorophyti TaxID=708187 RepID=A0A1Q8RLS5_9PEZI|nr:Tropinone reductase 2 [Colletotrichum chlorophyti]